MGALERQRMRLYRVRVGSMPVNVEGVSDRSPPICISRHEERKLIVEFIVGQFLGPRVCWRGSWPLLGRLPDRSDPSAGLQVPA
jgi:hypothetical protein